MNTVKDITGDEYLELVDCYGGLCLSCLEFKYDGCEPDAEGYHCNEFMKYGNEFMKMVMIL